MKKKTNLLFALTLVFAGAAAAQDSSKATTDEKLSALEGKVDGLSESYLETKSTVDGLNKLKFGGYIQAQWQMTSNYGIVDSTTAGDSVLSPSKNGGGVPTVAGGSFPGQSNQRFQIRRARLKATYSGANSKYVLELDGSLANGIAFKDAYVQFTEPWLNTFSLTLGNMDRPFGFEIGYSSASMEWPERSRLENNIFNGEKDLGVKLEVNPTEKLGFLQFLNLKGGLYTGNEKGNGLTGIPKGVVPVTAGDETDNGFDFIGRAGFKAPFSDIGLAIDGGASILLGKTQTANDTVYIDSNGTHFVMNVTDTSLFKTKVNKPTWGEWKYFDRTAVGVDLQLYYDVPVIGGLSLRGEYVQGKEPGTSGSTVPYGLATDPMYLREYSGFYVAWVQNLGPKLQSVVRFDEYDPNTKVSGSAISDTSINNHLNARDKALNLTDLKYDTWGVGLTYYVDGNLKFLIYYDMPKNESINNAQKVTKGSTTFANYPYAKDIDDNVLTVRMQVKF